MRFADREDGSREDGRCGAACGEIMRRIVLGEKLAQREEATRRSGRNWRRFHSSDSRRRRGRARSPERRAHDFITILGLLGSMGRQRL